MQGVHGDAVVVCVALDGAGGSHRVVRHINEWHLGWNRSAPLNTTLGQQVPWGGPEMCLGGRLMDGFQAREA